MSYVPMRYSEAEVLRWIEAVVIPSNQVTVAVVGNGLIAGFAAVNDGCLDHLYVAPSRQGRGIGKQLLDASKELYPEGLRLHVFQRNVRARAFYEKYGFRLAVLRDGSHNEEHEPDAVYEWHPDRYVAI